MRPWIAQTASSVAPKLGRGDIGSTRARAAFDEPTVRGRLVVACLTLTGGLDLSVYFSDPRFRRIRQVDGVRDLKVIVWACENAPPIRELTAWTSAFRGLDLELFEVGGISQLNALDRLVVATGDSQDPAVSTPALSTAGEFVLGVVASQYASAVQGGFAGGLSKLLERVVPGTGQQDWERGRTSFHTAVELGTAARRIAVRLSTRRRWICLLITFRPGTAPNTPSRMTATRYRRVLRVGGRGRLTAFGPLRATKHRRILGSVPGRARIGPFEGQIRIGGWSGLLVGPGTPYRVESREGLGGRTVRNSDDDLPRADGASRGVDLQDPRQFMVKLNWDGSPAEIEQLRARLYRAVPIRRDSDDELIFREPGGPLWSVWCRAVDVPRTDEDDTRYLARQPIVFRAVDPRHYSAIRKRVVVPVTPDEGETVTIVGATNDGNARAYPLIRVIAPLTGPTVERVQLINISAAVTFDVAMTYPPGAELVGDMSARATQAPVSPVTLDGQSKYGAWQLPRDTFYLAPAPEAENGVNLLYVRTTPTGVPVTCTLDFYDTSSG